MKKSDILKKVNEIFIDVLDKEDIKLKSETNSNDIEEWDSLNHVIIVSEIQKAFNISFSSKEIISWNNVGEMVNNIYKKLLSK